MNYGLNDRVRVVGPSGNQDQGRLGTVVDICTAQRLYPDQCLPTRRHKRTVKARYSPDQLFAQVLLDGNRAASNYPVDQLEKAK